MRIFIFVLVIAVSAFAICNISYTFAIDDTVMDSTSMTNTSISNQSTLGTIENSKNINFTNAIEKFNIFSEMEAPPPTTVEDLEEFEPELLEKENIDALKEEIQTEDSAAMEGAAGDDTTTSIDPSNISSIASSNTINNNNTNPFTEGSNEIGDDASSNNTLVSSQNQNSLSMQAMINTSNDSSAIQPFLTNGWDGLNQRDFATLFLVEPPDVNLAVGPNHVVQMVNTAMKIWDKEGNEIGGAPLSVFYGTGTHGLSDPIIRYDDESKRWFTAIMDTGQRGAGRCNPQCSILVAVSKTDNPTGTWHLVEFPFGNKFADYPYIDITTDKFILSVNLFTLSGPQQGDAHVAVVDKNAMLQGSNISYNLIKLPNVLTAYTVNTLNPSNCGYLTSTTDFPQTYQTGVSNKLRLFTICGDPLANNITTKTFSMVNAGFPQNGNQPPLGADRFTIDTGDIRVKSAIFDGKKIWQSFNVSCQPSQSFSLQSCVRFQQIDLSTSPDTSLVIDRNVGISNDDMYYPTMMINNQGKMIFSSVYSGPTTHPSLVLGDQDTLTNKQLHLVKQGSATYQGDRFGDYCEGAIDPTDKTLWMSCEYMNRDNADLWSTYIFNIK